MSFFSLLFDFGRQSDDTVPDDLAPFTRSLFISFSTWAARQWAETAVMWYGYELGTDSEYIQEMKDVIKSPQTQRSWGTRVRQSVGGPVKKT